MLRDRLSMLRRQAGMAPAEPAAALVAPTLAERVARARGRGKAVARVDDATLAARLDGALRAPGVIELRHRFALGHCHGRQTLNGLMDSGADLPGAPAGSDWLFLDTETSGLSGGTGTLAFLLGLARVDGDAFEVRQWLLTTFAGEPHMLAFARAWAGDATLVTYNGKCFDVPLLATRLRLHGEADNYAGRPHLDLLFPTRRAFAPRWDDCRLVTAERRLVGFSRPDDIPGAEVPAAWFDWLHRGAWARLAEVVRHNLWDLLSLAALLPALGEAYRHPQAAGAHAGAVARAWAAVGDHARAIEVLSTGEAALDDDALAQLAALHRRVARLRRRQEALLSR
jgi:uncharacterized protein YprB with RNaseH-like and TPR domain